MSIKHYFHFFPSFFLNSSYYILDNSSSQFIACGRRAGLVFFFIYKIKSQLFTRFRKGDLVKHARGHSAMGPKNSWSCILKAFFYNCDFTSYFLSWNVFLKGFRIKNNINGNYSALFESRISMIFKQLHFITVCIKKNSFHWFEAIRVVIPKWS